MIYAKIYEDKDDKKALNPYWCEFFGSSEDIQNIKNNEGKGFSLEVIYEMLADNDFVPVSENFFYKK